MRRRTVCQMRRVFQAFLFGMVAVLIVTLSIHRAIAESPAAGYEKVSGKPAAFAPAESCKDCHEDIWNAFEKTKHGNAKDPRAPASKEGCQTCHGPMAEHVDAGGGKETVNRRFGKDSPLTANEKSAVCLQCHEKGNQALWEGSVHQGKGLACMNCHAVHGGNPKFLKFAVVHENCFQCHKDKKSEVMNRPSHHPIKEGKMSCNACHNPHGSPTKHLIAANSTNELCYQCHTEKRGPFLFEHRPVTENCAICHTPHGSNHLKLLKEKLPFLCQSCHSVTGHPSTPYVTRSTGGPFDNTYEGLGNLHALYRGCINCHSNIHGSNHPAGQRLLR